MTNRFGDFFLFAFFSFSFFSSVFLFSSGFFFFLTVFFLILCSFTKRAQFPFSRWLPKAIRAPTPVSSLVHRSTLVTAGLILLFNFFFYVNYVFFSFNLFFFGLLTIFFSSLSALFEVDLKKIVALSTLSQIGFSIMTLGFGIYFVSFIHLVSHALFKSCLFIQVGYLIHSTFGQQDGRFYNNRGNYFFFIHLQILVTLFCLCGLFFFRGIVSKDFILEFFFFNNFFFFFSVFFFLSVFFTFFYCYRL